VVSKDTHCMLSFSILRIPLCMQGLVGPALGGLLHRLGNYCPLVAVVLIYFSVFAAVFLFYRKHVLHIVRDLKSLNTLNFSYK
jgi:hypothetical protein